MSEQINPYDIVCDGPYAPIPNCISVSTELSDSEKLLLGRLYQYAGQDGKAYPFRKNLAADLGWALAKLKRVMASLKEKKLVRMEKSEQNAPRLCIFLDHGVYHKPVAESKRENRAAQTKGGTKDETTSGDKKVTTIIKPNTLKPKEGVAKATPLEPKSGSSPVVKKGRSKPCLRKETIELIKYWNSFDSLRTHKLVGKDKYVRTDQSKAIVKVDGAVYRLLKGTYYSRMNEIPKFLREKQFTVAEIKVCIERLALATSSNYNHSTPKKVGFAEMIENIYAKILPTGTDKFRYRYPLIHWHMNTPVPMHDRQTQKSTDYENLVKRVIGKLNDHSVRGTKYNRVVTQVEKAVDMINQKANGNRLELMGRLPDLLYDSLVDVGKGIDVESLPLGVWNLERMMKQRNII